MFFESLELLLIFTTNLSESNAFAAIFGGIMLLVGASGVFAEIQSSINQIWGFKSEAQ